MPAESIQIIEDIPLTIVKILLANLLTLGELKEQLFLEGKDASEGAVLWHLRAMIGEKGHLAYREDATIRVTGKCLDDLKLDVAVIIQQYTAQ